MRQFRVTALSFVDGSLVEPGAIISLPDGVRPGRHMELIEVEAPPERANPRPIPKRKTALGSGEPDR